LRSSKFSSTITSILLQLLLLSSSTIEFVPSNYHLVPRSPLPRSPIYPTYTTSIHDSLPISPLTLSRQVLYCISRELKEFGIRQQRIILFYGLHCHEKVRCGFSLPSPLNLVSQLVLIPDNLPIPLRIPTSRQYDLTTLCLNYEAFMTSSDP
jgi:hypothetical protein